MLVVTERERFTIHDGVEEEPERKESVVVSTKPRADVAEVAEVEAAASIEDARETAGELGELTTELVGGVGKGLRIRLSASAVPREAPTMPKMMRKTSNHIWLRAMPLGRKRLGYMAFYRITTRNYAPSTISRYGKSSLLA